MKVLTPRHGLIQPGENDYYTVQDQNQNMEKLDKTVVSDHVAHIVVLTQEEYDDMSVHDPLTLYVIRSEETEETDDS